MPQTRVDAPFGMSFVQALFISAFTEGDQKPLKPALFKAKSGDRFCAAKGGVG
jgi:hypothetical protein